MIIEVRIDVEFLQTCGAGSLTGHVLNEIMKVKALGVDPEFLKGETKYATQSIGQPIDARLAAPPPDTVVRLVFPQTSLSWRRDHGGPDVWMMPEYTLPELLRCVQFLAKNFGVEVLSVVEDPR